jgi:poly(hydroxyalkanoate) depolymerase family esterase
MPPIDQSAMAEATRLTREGRLHEAMALIQRSLPPGSATRAVKAVLRSTEMVPKGDLIDLEPPVPGSGAAWSVPPRPEPARRPRGPSPDLSSRLDAALRGPGRGGAGARQPAREPDPLPAGARFEQRVHRSPAGARPYRLYVPRAAAEGQPLPVIVMLHGCTQDALDFAAGTRMNAVAEEAGLIVVYPEQTQAANAQRCWNWFNPGDQRRGMGEPALLAGMVRAVMDEFAVPEGRAFVAGLSAGGAAAAVTGAAYPELFAGIGVHSGLACGAARDVPSAFAAMRQGAGPSLLRGPALPAIVFHGDRDGTVHPVNGEEVAAQAGGGAGMQAEVERGRSAGGMGYTRTVHRDEAGVAFLEQWLLHGAGHAWSGGDAAGSYTDPRGPDASREMTRFFLDRLAARR